MTSPEPSITVSDVLHVLTRRWLTVAVTTVVVLALAALYLALRPTSYTAQTMVSVSPINASQFTADNPTDSIDMLTEQQVAESDGVATRTAEIMADGPADLQGGFADDPAAVKDAVTATVAEDVNVLNLDFVSSDPDVAAAGANAAATAYLQLRKELAVDAANTTADELLDKIRSARVKIIDPTTSPGISGAASAQLATLREQRANLQLVQTLSPGEWITTATPPTSTAGIGAPVVLGGALVAGLLLGALAALTRDRTDRKVRTAERLTTTLGLPVIDGTGRDDAAETWRLSLMALGLPREGGDDRAFVVSVLSASGSVGPDAAAALLESVRRAGMRARLVAGDQVSAAAIEDGWPQRRTRERWTSDVVVLDLTGLQADSYKASVSARSTATVMVAEPGDSLPAAARLARLIEFSGSAVDLAVLRHHGHDNGTTGTGPAPTSVGGATGDDPDGTSRTGSPGQTVVWDL